MHEIKNGRQREQIETRDNRGSLLQLTNTAVAISIFSKQPPTEELNPQQAPLLFTATEKMLDAHACSSPVASSSSDDLTYGVVEKKSS